MSSPANLAIVFHNWLSAITLKIVLGAMMKKIAIVHAMK